MSISGSRVGIVGGSIAGCAAAIALRHAGCEVTVFERGSGQLGDRGFGIGMPLSESAELVEAGFLGTDLPSRHLGERAWVVRDGENPVGRVVWRQKFTMALHSWKQLWTGLRSRVPDSEYCENTMVSEVNLAPNGAELRFADGSHDTFDLVVGADGSQSIARNVVDEHASIEPAGYCLWRGSYAAPRLPYSIADFLEHGTVTVAFPGGHCLVSVIPGSLSRTGKQQLYWAVYSRLPPDVPSPRSTASVVVEEELANALDQLLEARFPSYWADVARASGRPGVVLHPVFDVRASRYVHRRIALVGDAGTIVRPHTGSGAVKALRDALVMGQTCAEHDTWDDVLSVYDTQRSQAAGELLALGRRIGRAQVLDTPQWDAMTPNDFETWMQETLDGKNLYLYER